MNTIEDRLRDATRDVHTAVVTTLEPAVPPTRRRFTPLVAVAAGVAAVLLIGLPLTLLRGGSAQPSDSQQPSGSADTTPVQSETTLPTRVVDESEIPAVVLEYWALEGTLESVGVEEGWLCPAQSNAGFTSVVDEVDMPQELLLEIPGLEPVEVFNRGDGPVCHQPPLLVMLAASADGPGLSAEAGMTVWPKVTRFEDTCDNCEFVGGPIDQLTINDQPARLQFHSDTGHYDVWWVDDSGTPMYAETSGLNQDRVLELIHSIHVEPAIHRAAVAPEALGDLEMLSDNASVGTWETGQWRLASYSIEGTETEIAITTTRDASFETYARFASFVDYLSLVEVYDTPAVWAPEAGNFLTFTNPDGVQISIEGAPSIEEAIKIAEQLQ